MNVHGQRLKHCIEDNANTLGVPFYLVQRAGLADFMADGFDNAELPQKIAIRALSVLCTREKNMAAYDSVICVGAIRFLDKCCRAIGASETQRIIDLANIIKDSSIKDEDIQAQFEAWFQAWYR